MSRLFGFRSPLDPACKPLSGVAQLAPLCGLFGNQTKKLICSPVDLVQFGDVIVDFRLKSANASAESIPHARVARCRPTAVFRG